MSRQNSLFWLHFLWLSVRTVFPTLTAMLLHPFFPDFLVQAFKDSLTSVDATSIKEALACRVIKLCPTPHQSSGQCICILLLSRTEAVREKFMIPVFDKNHLQWSPRLERGCLPNTINSGKHEESKT